MVRIAVVALLAAAVAAAAFALAGRSTGADAAAVAAPAPYAVPRGAVQVRTVAGLRAALAAHRRTIVLEPGVYDAPAALDVPAGTGLYAAQVGGALLRMGLSIGEGPVTVRGLSFRVSSLAQAAADGAILEIWGRATGSTVEDVVLDGASTLRDGLDVRAPSGFVGRRIVARNLVDDGIVVDTYPHRAIPSPVPVLSDVDVSHVARPKPRSSNGTAEACLWLGVRISLQRARVRDCAWTGVWVGFDSDGGSYSGIDADGTPVGVYLEHYTTDATFRGLHVGSGVRVGVNCEWADPAYGRRPASVGNRILGSVFDSYQTGVFMDEGTRRTVVEDSTFRGQRFAAIVDFRGVANAYRHNDYSRIESSAVPVSHQHD